MSGTTDFPHIPLIMIKDAPPKKRNPSPRKIDPRTASNKKNRVGHAKTLSTSVENLQKEWQETVALRRQEGLPEIPEALSIFLMIDPSGLPIEDLRKFGIEVIGEQEDGYIIGASADVTLSQLRAKIQKFVDMGQHNVAALWNILQGNAWRIERILSPALLEEWPKMRDEEQLVVDVGIACLGTITVPEHPGKRKNDSKTVEQYKKALDRWQEKRDQAYEEWSDLAFDRYIRLVKFVEAYQGEVLSDMTEDNPDLASHLPDSFSCRIRISGKGLRDFVLNFQYLFDVSEVEKIDANIQEHLSGEDAKKLIIEQPKVNAPRVCVIDSGIQERHPLLRPAVENTLSRSWINTPNDVADYVSGGGHGTRVAGAVLYPRVVPLSGRVNPICWVQNARVLDQYNQLPENLFPPIFLQEIVEHFHNGTSQARIFNHSINASAPCRLRHMSIWAATIDKLTWDNDLLFIVSAGNVNKYGSVLKPGIREHITSGRSYPNYLLENACRIANPGQSLQAITVGSVGLDILTGLWTSFAKVSEPSAFSRTGPGIWNVIKPEVVEYGGDFAYDTGTPLSLTVKPEIAPQLVSSTLHGGQAVRRDAVGTSFSNPKVSHVAAVIQDAFPDESALLYRTLIVQSARWPEWADKCANKSDVIRHLGYGIPDAERATENSEYRITMITSGEAIIKGRQVHIYNVRIPEELRRPCDAFDIRIDITLSYKAQPRRTRRTRRRYLSTWLEWQTSKLNESSNVFISRMIDLAGTDNDENSLVPDAESGVIQWAIRERSDWGQIRDVNRNSGTVQKDWTVIKSHEFREGFGLAVIGHIGWNTDPEASIPYALAVSFEAINQDVKIYSQIVLENVIEVEERV